MKQLLRILALLLFPVFLFGQGLELSDKTIFKNTDGKTISLEEFQKYINTGDYTIDPSLDAQGNVVSVALLKLTKEDKIMADRLVEVRNDAEGKPITPFDVKTIDGKSYSSKGQLGKVTVIKFWFKECAPCIAEMPKLNQLADKYEDNEDVDFIAFGLDTKGEIFSFLRKQPIKYDIVSSAEPVRNAMQIQGFPTHIVVNKKGIVSEYIQGGHLYIDQKLEDAIEIALGNKSAPETGGLKPAEITKDGAVGFIIEPSTVIKNELGEEIDFDTFMQLMDTGNYEPHPAKSPSGKDYIIIKKKS